MMKGFMRYFAIFIYIFAIANSVIAQSNYDIKYEHQEFIFAGNKFIVQSKSDNRTTYQVTKYFNSPIVNPEPFLAVAFKLYGENLSVVDISVNIKSDVSDDWISFDYDDDVESITGELSSGIVFLDSKTKLFQFRIISSDEDAILSSIDFTFISPGKTSKEILEELKKYEPINFKTDLSIRNEYDFLSTSKDQDLSFSYPRPPVVTRTEWSCPQGQGSLGSPSVTLPTHLIVHHSAGSNSSSDWPAVVRSIYTLHTQTNGWSDVGYNWLIDPNGVIYQGRAWYQNTNDNVIGAHFCGTNSKTMGVCVMGTYTSISPTTAAKESLVEIFAYKANEQSIDPLGQSYHSSSGLTLYNICGHRNGCSTECPGTNLYNQLPQIRDSVYTLLNPTSVDEKNLEVDKFSLDQNYPNPFNPSTKISWQTPVGGWQTLKVYDVLGNEVATLVNEEKPSGSYEVEFDASKLTSGVYFYQLRAGDPESSSGQGFVETKKMILLR